MQAVCLNRKIYIYIYTMMYHYTALFLAGVEGLVS